MRFRCLLVWLVMGLGGFSALGRVNVVTLPGRDSVQLTIYNSVDLTLVKETRLLTFRKGLNRLEFSWANTLIDPTSVEFRALTHADEVEVLDASFPPRVTNTLEWRINSEFAGEVQVEIRYFTSGIRWSADYVAEALKTEKVMTLSGAVRVSNNSGEDYEHAQVRLVVGVIRLVEEIAQLARAKQPHAGGKPSRRLLREDENLDQSTVLSFSDALTRLERDGERKQITKEGLSEYFLYTVEGRDTIPTGWSKRLPSFKAAEVPITSLYKFEREIWGEKVQRFYRFTNSVAAHLGEEPLPDGQVKAFRVVTPDRLTSFVGSTTVKYIPVNEQVDLALGHDQEVRVEPTLMSWEKSALAFDGEGNVSGWTTRETWTVKIQNSKEIAVALDIRRNFSGDWSLETPSPYEKVGANKIKFLLPLLPYAKQNITYTLTTRHGTSVTK